MTEEDAVKLGTLHDKCDIWKARAEKAEAELNNWKIAAPKYDRIMTENLQAIIADCDRLKAENERLKSELSSFHHEKRNNAKEPHEHLP